MKELSREDLLKRELVVRATLPAMQGDAASRLAEALMPLEVPAGAWLFRAGEPPDQLFFVVDGELVLELPGHPPWTFGPRSVVGIIDLMLERPHRRGCRATRPTQLLAAPSSAWFDLIDDDMARSAIRDFGRQVHAQFEEFRAEVPPAPLLQVEPLPHPLPLYEKMLVLRETPLFRQAGTQALASLAQIAEELEFEAGAPIFEPNEVSSTLYVVVEGLVELVHEVGGSDRCGPLTVLGAVAALAGELCRYSAVAAERTVLLRIRDDDYYDQAEEHPELTRAALAYLGAERERLLELAGIPA